MTTILVLVDFSETSLKAFDQALDIASRKKLDITLYHCIPKNLAIPKDTVLQKFEPYEAKAKSKGVKTEITIASGDLFEQTDAAVKAVKPGLVIASNHGVESLDHRNFGSAIHKLVQQIEVPTLLVSHNSRLVAGGFRHIMIPAAPHPDFHIKVEAAAELIAEDGRIVLLTILDEGVKVNADSARNMQAAQQWLKAEGINFEYREVPATKHAIGYADQTLNIMADEAMDLISIMARISDAHRHFGKIDKERVLLADEQFQVLCANGPQ